MCTFFLYSWPVIDKTFFVTALLICGTIYSIFIIVLESDYTMSIVKPLLWLLEPYIVYKAYIWGFHFISRPITWEGDIDWFSLTLAGLLIMDAICLPLALLYLPVLNPDKPVSPRLVRLLNPIDRFVAWIDNKDLHAVTRRIVGTVWAFCVYLVPVYICGNLILAVVVALMYDILTWATLQMQ